ncbi:hypothetical protein JXA84_03435 [candidate division WOR-3 bacterium]|nr:hypothetical protein [candidate division WOR-3 bacterium]
MKKTRFFWVFAWFAYVVLSFDFWDWNKSAVIIFGLPSWIYWDTFLVFSLSPVLFYLVKRWDDKT